MPKVYEPTPIIINFARNKGISSRPVEDGIELDISEKQVDQLKTRIDIAEQANKEHSSLLHKLSDLAPERK